MSDINTTAAEAYADSFNCEEDNAQQVAIRIARVFAYNAGRAAEEEDLTAEEMFGDDVIPENVFGQ